MSKKLCQKNKYQSSASRGPEAVSNACVKKKNFSVVCAVACKRYYTPAIMVNSSPVHSLTPQASEVPTMAVMGLTSEQADEKLQRCEVRVQPAMVYECVDKQWCMTMLAT